MKKLTLKEIEKAEPKKMKLILQHLPPVSNDSELNWVIQKYKTDGIYIGQLNNENKKEGRGLIEIKDINLIGYFENDLVNGKAITFDKDFKNKIFEGNYVKGKREGHGILIYENGDKYEGNFFNNVKNGEGIYHYKSGASWKGHFDADKMNGEGLYSKNGSSKKVKFIKGIEQK